MTNDDVRKSISATLTEIEQTQQALGIASEAEELSETRKIVGRIESKLHKRRLNPPNDDDNWVTLGEAALRALSNINQPKGR